MICQECCHYKKTENDICRCTEDKIIGTLHIGLFNSCVFWNTTTKRRCKAKQLTISDDDFTYKLDVCATHNHTLKNKNTKTETTKSNPKTSKTKSNPKLLKQNLPKTSKILEL